MANNNTIRISIHFIRFSGMYANYQINDGPVQSFKYPIRDIVFFERNSDTGEAYPRLTINTSINMDVRFTEMKFDIRRKDKIVLKKSKINKDDIFFFKNNYNDYDLYINGELTLLTGPVFQKKARNLGKEINFSRSNFILYESWSTSEGIVEVPIASDNQCYNQICYEAYDKLKAVHWRETTYENVEEIDACIDILESLKRSLIDEHTVWKNSTASWLYAYLKKKGMIK